MKTTIIVLGIMSVLSLCGVKYQEYFPDSYAGMVKILDGVGM